jgi:hypothetical protein
MSVTINNQRGGYMTHCPYSGRAYSYSVEMQGFETFTTFCPPCAHKRGFTLEAAGTQRCGWGPVIGKPCHDCGKVI